MTTLQHRIKQIEQPNGGYLVKGFFKKTFLEDNEMLGNENISPVIVSAAVIRLAQRMNGATQREAFATSVQGFLVKRRLKNLRNNDELAEFAGIDDLSDESIIKACKLCAYDLWANNPKLAEKTPGPENVNPDYETIQNIRIMVARCTHFFRNIEPIADMNFNFAGAYTDKITSGKGEYLSQDGSMWIVKPSKDCLTKENRLEILTQYVMFNRIHEDEIKKIGIFNPRNNEVYSVDTTLNLPIKLVEAEVVGYEN